MNKIKIFISILMILFLCFDELSYAQRTKYDSTKINQSTELYEECTHPGKYEPAGVLASCCTEKGDWTFTYSYLDVNNKGNMQGNYKVADDVVFTQNAYVMSPNTMSMQMHMLMAMYGISERISAIAMTSYGINDMTMDPLTGSLMTDMTGMAPGSVKMPVSAYSSGFNDTKVFLFYKMRRECRFNVIIGCGISLQTGSTTVAGTTMFADVKRLGYPMQLGTGTWDIIPNITYFGQRNVTYNTILSYGVEARAEITPANNSQGYSFGNQYSLNTWVSYKFRNWISGSLRVKGIYQDAISGFNPSMYPLMYNDPSYNSNNFGGQWLNAFIGFNFYFDNTALKNIRLLIEYGMPLYQNLKGTQMALQNSIQLGCKYSF